jgi:energy-coupling factor transport system permease protein
MLKDITIGQYYPADSILHKLDPRVKFIGTIVFIVSIFLVQTWGYLICTGFLVSMIIISKVPFKFMIRGMKAILFLLIFTAVMNLLLTQGEVLWSFGILKITKEGIFTAIFMALRFTYLILGASLMTLTTTPNKLTDGLEKLFTPLKVIHFPVHEIAMMMSIALRFIPIIMEEADKIMKAQMARGADFENGNIIKKAKAMIPILVPLFVSSFRRANDLALAMEARCYHGGKGRTHMKPLKYKGADGAAYFVIALYLGVVITFRIVFGF